MNSYSPATGFQKTLKLFQALMLVITLVSMSFPVSVFAQTEGGEPEAPAPVVLDCEAEGLVLNETGDACIEAPAPEEVAPEVVALECEEPLVLNETGDACIEEESAPEVLGKSVVQNIVVQEDGPYEDTTEDDMCVVVSNTLTQEGGVDAVLVSNPHSAWTAVMDSIAKWIWGEDPTALAPGDEVETFTREFSVVSAPTGATLEIAADNSYTVSLNGNPVGADAGEFNYSSGGQDSYAVPSGDLLVGVNTLTFVVTNKDQGGETISSNPAGLRYKLTVEGADCGVPEVVDNSCVAPDTLGTEGSTYVNPESPDGSTKELQEITDDAGYTFDVDDDQSNIQQWNGSNNTVDFSVEFLSENAGDKLVFGYVVNGGAFVPVFKDPATNTGTYPQYSALPNQADGPFAFSVPNVQDVVFAIHNTSSNKFYYTTTSDNFDGDQHAVVYNMADNEYVVAFEDLENLGDKDYNDLVVEINVTDCEDGNTATIVATKIVCDNESDLPNLMGSSHVTDADTASDFLDTHPSCHLEEGWQFEWGNQTATDPGGDFIGHATGYTTSGLTAGDGTVTMSVPLDGVTEIRVRELLQDGYIPFTFDQENQSNANNVSAEISCSNDGLNYDNWDYVRNPEEGTTYYCVAWNVEKPKAPVCNPEIELLSNGGFENPSISVAWDIVPSGTSGLDWLVDWINPSGAPEIANAEFHKNVNGWLPHFGLQYAELDSDWGGPTSNQSGEAGAVTMSQEIATVPGQEYTFSFWFSPRPDKGAGENKVEALVDGSVVATTLAVAGDGSNTSWTQYSVNFVADDTTTTVALRDAAGNPNNSVGSFVDDASVTCTPEETATIIIQKEIQKGDPDGTFSFIVDSANEDFDDAVLDDLTTVDGYVEASYVVTPGEYDVTEVSQEDWTLYSLNCDWEGYGSTGYENEYGTYSNFTIEAGQTVTCTFQNSYSEPHGGRDGTLVIVKNTQGGDGEFEFGVEGTEFFDSMILQTEGGTDSDDMTLAEGTYAVTEFVPEGWTLSDVSCEYGEDSEGESIEDGEEIYIEAGDTVTCTFTNVKDDEDGGGSDEDDVCANLEGVQIEVPKNMHIVNGDQCKADSRRNGGSGGGSSSAGQVLGASTCSALLNDYLKFGWNNDPEEVNKLQQFLNDHLGTTLPLNGVFGPATFEAVKSFQQKYWEEVLKPWFGLAGSGIQSENTPTGFVYQTTRWQINNIWCPGSEAFPQTLN